MIKNSYIEEIKGILAVDLYDPMSCRQLIESVRAGGGWTRAEVNESSENGRRRTALDPGYRRAELYHLAGRSAAGRAFSHQVETLIRPLIRQAWALNLTRHSPAQIVRYRPGGFYRVHEDAIEEPAFRYFSVVCYLNDDFEGGETAFPSLAYAVMPRCGKAIIFPSAYPHSAAPVTRGEKYVLVSWLTGPPPARWI